jgi:hypothetical protein
MFTCVTLVKYIGGNICLYHHVSISNDNRGSFAGTEGILITRNNHFCSLNKVIDRTIFLLDMLKSLKVFFSVSYIP